MWDVKGAGNGTRITLIQNTSTLVTENVNMKDTLLITSSFKTVPNGSTQDTVVPGKEWRIKTSLQLPLHGCRSTVTDKNVTAPHNCDWDQEHRLSTAQEIRSNIVEHSLVPLLTDCYHQMSV
jgi:hypothetical protein